MRRLATAFATTLMLTAPVMADVIPPPEEITEIQQALVGTWQQTATTGMRGHGEGMETMFFDKERYVVVSMHALQMSNMYSISERSGKWSAERLSPTELKVTLVIGNPSPGYEPPTEILTVTLDGPNAITIPKTGRGSALVSYVRIYPKAAE